ncbi:PaaI family thioesterase [Caulobacter sp. B11]|uniref:PaaI family thioesterase n=1 Tax=Caulobacter sp. B11 TaxID=2048899 RepID=UPI001F292EE8|nr:PaaI family thioesterase [Caulobacter sp. B11]
MLEVTPGRVLIRQAYVARSLRPGGLISGPTQMGLADRAAYALVLAHIGEVEMAVTTSLTIHFLRGAKPGDLYAEAVLLKLGRRIATADVLMWTESRERAVSKATVAYAIPEGSRPSRVRQGEARRTQGPYFMPFFRPSALFRCSWILGPCRQRRSSGSRRRRPGRSAAAG